MIPKWEHLRRGESVRTELSFLILRPKMPTTDVMMSDEELNVSMTQFGVSLSNWGCFASEGPLGGLLQMTLGETALLLLPTESRRSNYVQNTDDVPRTVLGLCLWHTHLIIHQNLLQIICRPSCM